MGQKKRIFIVDDDAMFAQMLADYIEDIGDYEIFTYHSGEDCLKNLSKMPSTILLDHDFGKAGENAMDGMQTLIKIKEASSTFRVIMLTGQEDNEMFSDFIKNGASDYIPKNEDAFDMIFDIL